MTRHNMALCTVSLLVLLATSAANADRRNVHNSGNKHDGYKAGHSLKHERRQRQEDDRSLDFSGYSLPFAELGASRNVIVVARVRGDGGTSYYLRVRYANDSEQISVNGNAVVPDFIASYPFVSTDAAGNLREVFNSIDAPDTEDYFSYLIEESEYDVNSLAKTVTADTLRSTDTCGSTSVVVICALQRTASADDSFVSVEKWVYMRELIGEVTVAPGMTFPDVRAESFTRGDHRYRLKAKGIGIVFEERDNQADRAVVYYRVGNNEGGTLIGTPFEPGVGPLDDLFF